ncbi:hypothetical protein HY546_02550 [archaeon]|nr:hypothetical protein [archaeon]
MTKPGEFLTSKRKRFKGRRIPVPLPESHFIPLEIMEIAEREGRFSFRTPASQELLEEARRRVAALKEKELGPRVLVGSVAAGTARNGSDIDLIHPRALSGLKLALFSPYKVLGTKTATEKAYIERNIRESRERVTTHD